VLLERRLQVREALLAPARREVGRGRLERRPERRLGARGRCRDGTVGRRARDARTGARSRAQGENPPNDPPASSRPPIRGVPASRRSLPDPTTPARPRAPVR
jgi:hypothetical protein